MPEMPSKRPPLEADEKGGEDLREEQKSLNSTDGLDSGWAMDTQSDFAGMSVNNLTTSLNGEYVSADRLRGSMAGKLRGPVSGESEIAYHFFHRRGLPGVDSSWLNGLFAPLPALPAKPQEPKQPWPAEARAIARSLLRMEHLTGFKDGLRIELQTESFDVRWDTLTGRSQTTALVSPQGWLTVSTGDSTQTSLSWADAKERGSLAAALLLGACGHLSRPTSASRPWILAPAPPSPLDLSYAGYSVQLNLEGEHQSLLVLKHRNSPQYEIRFLVDTTRHVILKIENADKGKVISTTTFSDFVEIAGAWYAGRIESIGPDGRRNSTTTQKLTALNDPAAVGNALRGVSDGRHPSPSWNATEGVPYSRDRSQLLREPLPKLVDAKKALAAGKPAFEDQIVMLLHFQATQQWDRVLGHLAEAEKLSGKSGMRWVRLAVLPMARKAEEAKKRCLEEAELLAKAAKPQVGGNDLFLADYLVNNSNSILEANEQMRLLDALRPVYERQPAHVLAMKRWNESRCNILERTGQNQEVLKLRKQLAADYPHDFGLQQQYARTLANAGDFPAAYAWLDSVLVPAAKWLPYEEESLGHDLSPTCCGKQGRYDDVVEYLGAWVKRNPPSQNIYAQYLSALVWSDHLKQADGLVAQWIRDAEQAARALDGGPSSDTLPAEVDARLRAAAVAGPRAGLQPVYQSHRPPVVQPLGDAAICFARHPAAVYAADQIMGNYYFQQSDECRRVRKAALRMLLDEIGKLPVDQLQRLLNWISANDPAVEKEAWRKIAAGLREPLGRRARLADQESTRRDAGRRLAESY